MPLLDLVPVISAIIGIVGISFKAGMILQKMNRVVEEVKSIRTELKDIDRRVTILENSTVRLTKP